MRGRHKYHTERSQSLTLYVAVISRISLVRVLKSPRNQILLNSGKTNPPRVYCSELQLRVFIKMVVFGNGSDLT